MKGPLHTRKWMEGFSAPPAAVDRSHQCSKIARMSRWRTGSGQKVQTKCQRCCHCTKSAQEVLLSHQKCFLQTRSASTKPKVFPPNRNAIPEPEVHLNCFHQTGDAPKVLPLNWKGTKSASAKPEVHQKCFHQTGDAPKVRPLNWKGTKSASAKPEVYPKCFRRRGGAAVSWEVPLLHGRCHHHTGGAAVAQVVPSLHGRCHCLMECAAAATQAAPPLHRWHLHIISALEGNESTVGALEIERRSRRFTEGGVSSSRHTRNATATSEVDGKCHCQTGNSWKALLPHQKLQRGFVDTLEVYENVVIVPLLDGKFSRSTWNWWMVLYMHEKFTKILGRSSRCTWNLSSTTVYF